MLTGIERVADLGIGLVGGEIRYAGSSNGKFRAANEQGNSADSKE